MTVKEIRQTFLDFFASKEHHIVPSAPMVVKGDPTLMFTNAGMNQFKELFLGNSPIVFPRVADSQKCLRVSGKHNDLEEVGHDTYHHTMFEMLGNWSFGDYFKKEAIEWAWELLTKVFPLKPEDLYATIFEGSDEVARDTEAYEYWRQILPEDHIILGNKKDNFWEMGETGPCGPCSEIHVDLRPISQRGDQTGASLVNTGHPLVIEIWNLVFMQFNRKANGQLETLPLKHVDTGMGLERLCMAIQGKTSNYDTDIFQNLISGISKLCGLPYGQDSKVDVAMRVIADHLRAICFSIADGQLPSNVKAGYVIRRILRRAVRYGYTFLGFDRPFLCRLIPCLIEEMGEAYPELVKQQQLVTSVILQEEEAFLRALEKGNILFDNFTKDPTQEEFSGKDAFLLYDTYGFPIDLTILMAKEKGLTVNMKDFEAELAAQRERARKATENKEGDWVELTSYSQPVFEGYTQNSCSCRILRYRFVNSKNKKFYQIVLDHTPFYAECGGQVGDTGTLENTHGEKISITDTQKENNLIVHISNQIPEHLTAEFTATIDTERRQRIANNHTCTHLLQYALRQVLGDHIEQKGSQVADTHFRFDFSHYTKIEQGDIYKIERIVNNLIRSNIPLQAYVDIPIAEAQSMGATALFGEKYGDKVRVIQFGPSMELCGGTHTSATGNIGIFKIKSESAIAAGIRRIEAITGPSVELLLEEMQNTIADIQNLMSNNQNVIQAIEKQIKENTSMRKELEQAMLERVKALHDTLDKESRVVGGIHIVSLQGSFSDEGLKTLAFMFKDHTEPTAFVATNIRGGKPSLTVSLSATLVESGMHAGNIVRKAAAHISGGGGGQAFYAQAGGKNPDGLNAAMDDMIAQITK